MGVNITNRICPWYENRMKMESYTSNQLICYCDNDNCDVKPCTDSTIASKVYQEILAITGDEE